MPARIQIRGDTSANLTSADPVPAAREPVFATDTNEIRMGDGSTAWSGLTAIGGGGGGGSSPAYFQARRTDGAALDSTTTNPPSAEAAVLWNVEDVAETGFTYASGTGELTIGSALNGRKAEMSIQINGDGFTNRTQVVVELQRDTGSGYATLIRSANYNSRDSDQNEGATSISGFVVTLATDDKYRVMCSNNNDGPVGIFGTNGCFWSCVAG